MREKKDRIVQYKLRTVRQMLDLWDRKSIFLSRGRNKIPLKSVFMNMYDV